MKKIILTIMMMLTPFTSHALKFNPFVAELESAGRGTRSTFTVENDKDQPIAVQLFLVKRSVDINGKETRVKADDDFVLYPSQMILRPEQKRNVRVQYVAGDTDLESSYRIIAQELPVNLDGSESTGVKFLVRYENSTYVTPKGAEEKIVVDNYKIKNGKLHFVLNNEGSKHKVLKNAHLIINGKKYRAETVDGQNLLANSKRKFAMKAPTKSVKRIKISYE